MNNDPSVTRRYLAVFLPLLSVERLIRQRATTPESPFALIEKRKGAQILAACDTGALDLGLTLGMPLADARARVPELSVFPHDPDADRALLLWLVDACGRYTPMVATDPPDGIILDITGCCHIWDGEAKLVRDLTVRMERVGLTCRVAQAETPDKARALVRHGTFSMDGVCDVDRLSVRALDLNDDRLKALHCAGLRTLGDLVVRPSRPLAARLGTEAMAKFDRVLGIEDVRIKPRRHVPALVFIRRFAEPVVHSDFVLAVLQELMAEAREVLRERSEGGRRFIASLYRSDGDVRRLAIDTGVPNRDPVIVHRLFRERIDAMADPLDPGFGYDAVRLDIPVTEYLVEAQGAFESPDAADADFGAILDRLTTRLGSAHVQRFVAGDTHIPERAAASLPINREMPPVVWDYPDEGEPPLRPFYLFDPPQGIEVRIAQAPDGPPRDFFWRRERHSVVFFEGPERIADEWWRRKAGHEAGKGGFTRDYFRVEDDAGRRFWLFRDGLYTETEKPGWYLHGLFA